MPLKTEPYSRVQMTFEGQGKTKQSFKDECDINHMMATYQRTGQMPAVNPRMKSFQDFTTVPTFHAALNQVKDAELAFSELPSNIRKYFGNDPGEMLDFLMDPENEEEAVELGLMEAVPQLETLPSPQPNPEAPTTPEVATPTPPPATPEANTENN